MRNRKLIFAIALFFALSFLSWLPAPAEEKAKKVDLSGFPEFVKKLMDEWKVPGIAVTIVKDGKIIYAEGFGYRDVARKLPVTPKTLFAIGSTSKAFTATGMGILVDQGKLDWDKPVREYLPTFKLKDPFATDGMTPRDLVCHRSGLPRHDFAWINSSWSREELFHAMRYLEPSQPFRTAWQYQNFMFMTAGYLAGHIAGTTWEDFTRKNIFEPLGMKDSNFSVEDLKKSPDYSLPYSEIKEAVVEIPFRNIDAIGPAGSINSNITDMAQWLMLNLNKGKYGDKQVISEASLKEIHSPQMIMGRSIPEKELFYSMYGMGWMITAYRGHLYISHGGGIDGFITQVALLPKENAGMVILSNFSGNNPLPSIIAYNIADRILGTAPVDWYGRIKKQQEEAEKEREKAQKEKDADRVMNTSPSHPLEDYVGDYENPGYGIFSIKKDGDALKGTYDNLDFGFSHYHYDTFELSNEMFEGFGVSLKATFFTDKKGNISSISVPLESSVSDIVFTRMPDKTMADPDFLKKFVGTYIIEGEEESEGRIFLRGENTLVISIPGAPKEFELVPYKGTEFNLKDAPGYSAEFVLDEAGVVTGVKFKTPGGVMNATKK
ncbi:MAG: serine hydrolase [Candidatus Aminicenantes bacterium]|nr:serine hydrolase [Candidatus Aminicenantes bacterium]